MIKQILLTGCVILVFVFVLMYVFQRSLIYFPDRHTPKRENYHAQDMAEVLLATQDNIILHSWYKAAKKNKPTILYLHGNAGHIGYRMPLIRDFLDAGMGVFLLEYRGYGGNKGSPAESGLYEDANAALKYLDARGVHSDKLVVYGESLGTAVATQLAAQHQVCALILQAPLSSLANLARYHYPWIFVKPWDEYNSLARIKSIHAPILFLHGTRDSIVPYQEGLTLFNEANEPKKMVSFKDKDHNNLWNAEGFSNAVIQFIRTHCN